MELSRGGAKDLLQQHMHRNRNVDDSVYIIPSWVTSRVQPNLHPKRRTQTSERSKLEQSGLIVFDTGITTKPSLQTPYKHIGGVETGITGDNSTLQSHQDGRTTRESLAGSNLGASDDHFEQAIDDRVAPNTISMCKQSARDQCNEHDFVPPRFIDWAGSDGEYDCMPQHQQPALYTQRFLQALHETLLDNQHTSTAAAYKWVSEASHETLLTSYPLLLVKEGSRCTSGSCGAQNENSTASASSGPSPQSHSNDNPESSDTPDAVHTELLKKCNRAVMLLYQHSVELLDCYVVSSSEHTLVLKIWGAFQIILAVSHSFNPFPSTFTYTSPQEARPMLESEDNSFKG